jgi:hypothetical protein
LRTEIDKLVELVKFDYEHSLGFIDGVVRVSIGIRTIAMAGCLALLVAAVQTGQAYVAGFACAAALALGAQDAYHGWLYAEARQRISEMEKLLDSYYRLVQGSASTSRERELLKRLRRHRFGARPRLSGPAPPLSVTRQVLARRGYGPLPRGRATLDLRRALGAVGTIVGRARPRIVYLLLYPLLSAISLIVVIVLLVGGGPTATAGTTQICIGCHSTVKADAVLSDRRQTRQAGH